MFTPEQVKELTAPLVSTHVKTRAQAGRNLSYIESWWAISEANRIFGHDNWNRETIDLRQLGEPRLVDGKYRVGYMAKVRITVNLGEQYLRQVIREGCGFGSGIDKDADQAHESALKEAESDAMKRALMTFGNPFGLALYDKTQANVVDPGREPAPSPSGGRLPAAQAKREGHDARIKADIAGANAAGLRDWHENFDSYTAILPFSWLDSVKDMLEDRLTELSGEERAKAETEALDDGFRNAVGPAVSSRVAGHTGAMV